MKYKVAPTTHERVRREDDFIVPRTDLKGRITNCNRIFIEFAGYIIRHPDMPRARPATANHRLGNGQPYSMMPPATTLRK